MKHIKKMIVVFGFLLPFPAMAKISVEGQLGKRMLRDSYSEGSYKSSGNELKLSGRYVFEGLIPDSAVEFGVGPSLSFLQYKYSLNDADLVYASENLRVSQIHFGIDGYVSYPVITSVDAFARLNLHLVDGASLVEFDDVDLNKKYTYDLKGSGFQFGFGSKFEVVESLKITLECSYNQDRIQSNPKEAETHQGARYSKESLSDQDGFSYVHKSSAFLLGVEFSI